MRLADSAIYGALLACAVPRVAAVTIYTTFTQVNGSAVLPTNTDTATGPAYTGYTAYNLTTLTPPALPSPLPNLDFDVQMYAGATGVANLSIPQKGSFFGYSIELSVANQFLGRNSSSINPAFLNYVANIRARIGHGMNIRVGGNSQEAMELFFTPFDGYEIINKTKDTNPTALTDTPEVNIDVDLLYTLNNITNFVGTQWYLGLPFAYPLNISGISELTGYFEDILGDNLIALQLGNEPDLYGQQYRGRPFDYWIPQYLDEWNEVIPWLQNNSMITRQSILLAPSICCDISGNWSIQDLLNYNFIDLYDTSLAQLAVQYYPRDNCAGDNPPQAQDIFGSFLTHQMQLDNIAQYTNASAVAYANNKPFIMYETNTASCSGFSGLSDSFGATLWAIDWAMTLAFNNFSAALFHFGGQDAAYNSFTPPPSNWSSNYQWTTGAIYYSNLVVAETLGASNASQIVDLQLNTKNPYTVGYGIYENGTPSRILLINFMDDLQTGTAKYTGYVHIGGINGIADTTPSTVDVRYLSAPSVSEKFNITWAGQTMGGQFMSDGRLQGTVNTQTITCIATTGCPVPVPAPGAALIFLSSTAESESFDSSLTATFPTTYYSQGGPTVDRAVLATSNGRGGPQQAQHPLGSTSHGDSALTDAATRRAVASFTLLSVAMGAALVWRMMQM